MGVNSTGRKELRQLAWRRKAGGRNRDMWICGPRRAQHGRMEFHWRRLGIGQTWDVWLREAGPLDLLRLAHDVRLGRRALAVDEKRPECAPSRARVEVAVSPTELPVITHPSRSLGG